MKDELLFTVDKIVTSKGKDEKIHVKLEAEDDDENVFKLSVIFEDHYPEKWADILGRIRGDALTVTFGSSTQQKRLD